MKIVAMVPIKMNNERIPGKNIKKFDDGTPLLQCLLKTLVNIDKIDEIYVYCSDENINNYLIDGVKFKKRSQELDKDTINCNDILESFMREVDSDIYIASHVTGPFTSAESVIKCLEAVESGVYDSAFLATKMQEFLWSDGKALNFDINYFPRTQDLEPIYSEAPGAYVFSKGTFEKYHRRVGIKPYICEISKIESIDIDNPIDFMIANAVYMNILNKN